MTVGFKKSTFNPVKASQSCRAIISGEELKAFDRKGLIPGPGESAYAFVIRARKCLEDLEIKTPFMKAFEFHLQSAFNQLDTMYGVRPEWPDISIDFSLAFSLKLGYWQERAGSSGQLFLRKELMGGNYWGYHLREVLAHELAHAARCAFPADLLDEYLSYQLSPKWYRRFLGPLLSSPALLPLSLAAVIVDFLRLSMHFFNQADGIEPFLSKGLFWIQVALGLWALKRLTQLALFERAKRVLERICPGHGTWWLFRLTQKEALIVGVLGRWTPFKYLGGGLRRQLICAKLKTPF